MARSPSATLTNPMQPARQGQAGAGGDVAQLFAQRRTCGRRRSTAPRAPMRAAAPSCSARALSPTPSSTRSTGSSMSSSAATQRRSPIVVLRVHEMDAPLTAAAGYLVDHPGAECAGARAGADERDGRARSIAASAGDVMKRGGPSARVRRGPRFGPSARRARPATPGCRRRRRRRAWPNSRGRARRSGPVVGVAGRRAHVEELLERQLAVEDVAADQAVLLRSRAARRCPGT